MQGFTKAYKILFYAFFVTIFNSSAQTVQIKGRVIDVETLDPLAFVSIQANGGTDGCISDIDGKFNLRSSEPIKKMNFSYIGYEPLEVIPASDEKSELEFRMQKVAYELSEIVIKPGNNPANRIIREVIANRYINDHEHLPSFTYTSYEKMIFGPESDSMPYVDSLSADSSYLKARAFFGRQHLFIMESVVNRSFKFPSENYNKVIASRVSGLSDPLFVFLISQLQSTTFYKEVIKIMDRDYINPISNGCFNKYYFKIQDTIIEPYPYDTTFVISFRPLLNTNFDGLKGTISISTNGYAIRNIIAIPAVDQGMVSIKIQQLYSFIDSTHWFPTQLNTDIIFKNAVVSIDSVNIKIMGRGKSYISNVNLHPQLRRNQFGAIEVDVQPDAYSQPEKIWNDYRIDTLSQREKITYQVIDSLGKAENFNRFTKRLDALMSGKVNLGYFDLYLDYLFKVNHYEGFRPGLKLSTSDKESTWFKLTGYGAYGFKDKEWKYGADGSLIFNRFNNFYLKAGFYDEVDEAGADPKFDIDRNFLNPSKFRDIMVEKMDNTRCYEAKISSRLLKYLTLTTGVSVYNRNPLYEYSYKITSADNISVTNSSFSFTEASFLLRYAYGEKFIKNTRSIVSLGTNYPIVQFSAIHGFNDVLDGQYIYNRFDFKVNKSFFTKYIGKTTLDLQAGFIDRDIPYVNLYNARSSYRPFTFYSPGSFATMRMDEFTADRYAALFISHNFGKLLYQSKHFKPEPEFVTNIGIGALRHPENHEKENIKSYEKGYYESGIVLNRLLRLGLTDIGMAWFYRYGPYSLPTPKENLAWKIVFQFVM